MLSANPSTANSVVLTNWLPAGAVLFSATASQGSYTTSGSQVRYAIGDEQYLTFSGQSEHPGPGEVIFADQARQVHARRWTNRQSGLSAVGASTTAALIVAEAMHSRAASDVPRLIAAITGELDAVWSITPAATVLCQASPRFTFEPRPQ